MADQILLVRHGETDWNRQNLAQGSRDIELNPRGLAQTQAVAQALKEAPVTKIFSSDLGRCSELSCDVADHFGLEVEYMPNLRERKMGVFEGRDFTDMHIELRHQVSEGTDQFDAKPEGGESIRDVFERAESVARKIDEQTGTVLVVSHGMALAAVLAHLVAGTVYTSRAFRFQNAAITELRKRPDGIYMMVRYNDSRHLGDPDLSALPI
ncbi:MAG: histidine phosphatase family protein [Fimbriimonadaceae bacterium]